MNTKERKKRFQISLEISEVDLIRYIDELRQDRVLRLHVAELLNLERLYPDELEALKVKSLLQSNNQTLNISNITSTTKLDVLLGTITDVNNAHKETLQSYVQSNNEQVAQATVNLTNDFEQTVNNVPNDFRDILNDISVQVQQLSQEVSLLKQPTQDFQPSVVDTKPQVVIPEEQPKATIKEIKPTKESKPKVTIQEIDSEDDIDDILSNFI